MTGAQWRRVGFAVSAFGAGLNTGAQVARELGYLPLTPGWNIAGLIATAVTAFLFGFNVGYDRGWRFGMRWSALWYGREHQN